MMKKPNSVRENDAANNVDQVKADYPGLPPTTMTPIAPIDILFDPRTYALAINTPLTVFLDSGFDEFVVYVGGTNPSAAFQMQFSLGFDLDHSRMFEINIGTFTKPVGIRFPGQSQAITINASAVINVTIVGLKNCDFWVL